jgi:hypothetical protein
MRFCRYRPRRLFGMNDARASEEAQGKKKREAPKGR